MSISKQVTESLDKKILNLKKLNSVKVTETMSLTPSTGMQLRRTSASSLAWENISENIKIPVKEWEQLNHGL